MNAKLSPIIQAAELLKIHKSDNIRIVDVRSVKSNFEAKHIEGAVYVDLNTQLSEIKDDVSIGGRHPLPSIENFAKTISMIGIDTESHVIVYDDQNGSNAAARLWWMLKAIGHEKVQVLNGGIQEAEKSNLPLSSKTGNFLECELYNVKNWKLPIAEIEEVEKVSQKADHMVIDVRAAERYAGKTEPIDLVAGHIPGAINVPLTENLDENGLFLSPMILKEKYQTLFRDIKTENIIVHCGSGVTACHTLLAIAIAGLEIPKLYVGSWSEWSRNNKSIDTDK